MQFHVDPADELPIYRQIMRQVLDAVAASRLRPGDQLPSHRELAAQLVVAPLTVKKAYDELERAGVIRLARGTGSFIAEAARELDVAAKRERVRPLVKRLLQEAALLGLDLTAVERLLRDESATLGGHTASGPRELAVNSKKG